MQAANLAFICVALAFEFLALCMAPKESIANKTPEQTRTAPTIFQMIGNMDGLYLIP